MDFYFCPKCGRHFDASECLEQGDLLRCPECIHVRVMVRGRILVACGLVILFLSVQIFPPYVPALGILIGGGLCVMGMIRSLRQIRAKRSSPPLELHESEPHEEEDPDDWG